ncbi:MAG: hypothetical protein WC223_05195 [Bacteroidales bacterium]|jgi:hypothetical protein
MKPTIPLLIIRTFIFSFCLLAAGVIEYFTLHSKFVSSQLWALLILFTAVTIIIFLIIKKLSGFRPGQFISSFMLLTFVKLVFFIFILSVYVFYNRSDAVAFVINFFVLYVFYTVFEIISILSLLKK